MQNVENIIETENIKVLHMRIIFALTAVCTIPLGLIMMLAPGILTDSLGWVLDEPLFPSAYAGCLIAFGILSILGYQSPVKYAPVLFFQFTYKTAWIVLLWLPLFFKGELPEYHLYYSIGMFGAALYDLYAVPFAYLLKKESV